MKTFTKTFVITTMALTTILQSCSNENVSKYSSTPKDVDNNKYWKNGIEINLPYIYQGGQIQNVDPIDLNNDGLQDIILHTSLGQHYISSDLSAPFKDALVVYIQERDGSYRYGNEEIFGKEIIGFGAQSGKKVFADFNNDSFIDVAYSLHREDGRPGPVINGNLVWGSTQQVVMSNGDGTYRIDILSGPPLYQTGITTVKFSDTITDLVYGGGYPVMTVSYRYHNNKWIIIESYPTLSGWDILGIQNYLLDYDNEGRWMTPPQNGITLYKQSDNVWLKHDYFTLGIFETSVNQGMDNAFRYNNQLMINFNMVNSCALNLNDNTKLLIARLESSVVPENYFGYLDYEDLPLNIWYTAIQVDENGLKELDILKDRFTKEHGVYFTCNDINADGYEDVVVHTKDSPVETFSVFLNNQGKELILTNLEGLSEIGSLAPHAFYQDINNDGLGDIVIQNLANLKIYLGTEPQLIMEK